MEMYVKVMTDEQIEVLRKQIAAYATICEQLVDLHKSLTSQHDLPGMRLGNPYNDPYVTSTTHRITGRQRWTPTAPQLQILEQLFDQGTGTPNKQKIREITIDLLQYGTITETNVYNWFQNRRARSKRKQYIESLNNVESEVETEVEVELPNENKTKLEENLCSTEIPPSTEPEPEPVSKPVDESFNQISYYGRMDQLLGKMEEPESYSPYLQPEEYNMNLTE